MLRRSGPIGALSAREPHRALARPGDLGLVEGMDLYTGAATVAVEAGGQIAGDVLAPHGAAGLLDAREVAPGWHMDAADPSAPGAVGDGQSGSAGRRAGARGRPPFRSVTRQSTATRSAWSALPAGHILRGAHRLGPGWAQRALGT